MGADPPGAENRFGVVLISIVFETEMIHLRAEFDLFVPSAYAFTLFKSTRL